MSPMYWRSSAKRLWKAHVCAFTPSSQQLLNITLAANFKAYEQEDDTTKDLSEFALANAIYTALVEGHAAEINARCVPSAYRFAVHWPHIKHQAQCDG